jgi:hypothetical protein
MDKHIVGVGVYRQ